MLKIKIDSFLFFIKFIYFHRDYIVLLKFRKLYKMFN